MVVGATQVIDRERQGLTGLHRVEGHVRRHVGRGRRVLLLGQERIGVDVRRAGLHPLSALV
ncbi:hypothetical protein HNQ07_000898 [Deinococcus metalli]|uniref:Uncharacterized protein n=1 Tax=Deinococcus metalli TaxID=1141878 RepID=A0A7W8NM61_9DEIO|nr:hypothetical protein [Deinococcus metalli]MBB5375454.1 hypothetical protein [Deinococcus metalli]GHF29157.1 hypothetical protein GCM10017781_01410 [Deinococcus metalli]